MKLTKFSLKEKVYVRYAEKRVAGIIGGITLVNGNDYLVVEGNDIYASYLTNNRDWHPESFIEKRKQDELV